MPDVEKTKNVTDGQVGGLNYNSTLACSECCVRQKEKVFFGV